MWRIAPEVGRKLIAAAFPKPLWRKAAPPPELAGSLGRIGPLEVRLAATKKDVRKAQRLRFKVFFEEGHAKPNPKAALTRRDSDRFDKSCDHLIVIDHSPRARDGKIKPKVVGAYRLLRGDVATGKRGFYSSGEYDIAPLLARHEGKRFLELGRSCVLESYRGKRTIELLWRGLLAYIRQYDIDALIGCASFEGANPLAHAVALSFLAHHARAEGEWQVRARDELHVPMDLLGKDSVDLRKALGQLPPLIKGYLRVGAKFGDGAVVDRKFNTTDVFVVMPVAEMDVRYLDFFGGSAASNRRAA